MITGRAPVQIWPGPSSPSDSLGRFLTQDSRYGARRGSLATSPQKANIELKRRSTKTIPARGVVGAVSAVRGHPERVLGRVGRTRVGATGIATVLLALGFSTLAALVAVPSPASALTPHAPIVIVGTPEVTGGEGEGDGGPGRFGTGALPVISRALQPD